MHRTRLSLVSLLILSAGVAAAAPDTMPAEKPADAAASQPATAPASSPLHDEILAAYMQGRWDALETMLKDKAREIAGLTREEQVDVVTIRLALKEGRQDWWKTTKAGARIPIKVSLWGRTIPVLFDPKTKYGMQNTYKKGQQALSVAWTSADMDSTAPADPGFTRGDAACLTAFTVLGGVDSWSQVTPVAASAQVPLDRYLEFRGKLTAMAFGTPGARRYGLWICLSSCSDDASKTDVQIRSARRAIATMFLGEVLTHPGTFPSLELPKTLTADKAEEELCKALADSLAARPWTFAEDNAVKTAAKSFAAANGPKCFTTAAVTLPNKLTVSLDPRADAPNLAQRNAWLKQQFDKFAPAAAK